MKFTTEDGKEYEFRGEYHAARKGEYLLSDQVGGAVKRAVVNANTVRAIVHPILAKHTFGGVVFEETGEVRLPHVGEWVLSGREVYPAHTAWRQTYPILRCISIE